MRKFAFAAAAALGVAFPALAEEAKVATAESEEFGTYLTDGEGRPLYMFTTDSQAQDGKAAVVSCEAACLEAWPLFTTDRSPETGEGASDVLMGTLDHGDAVVVTYNGWPLYYFAEDEGADTPQGQDVESFGGEWYLLTPDGEKVGHD